MPNSYVATTYVVEVTHMYWDKCTEWSQNDSEHYKVRGIQYVYVTSVPPSYI